MTSFCEFNKAVFEAAGNENIERLEAALSLYGHLVDTPNPQQFNSTPLHNAAIHGRTSAIELLVRSGSFTIDTPNDNGLTPLHLAAEHGHARVIETLIRLGSLSIDAPRVLVMSGKGVSMTGGATAMHLAVENGHSAAVEALLQLGSRSMNTLAVQNVNPIQAALSGHFDPTVPPSSTPLSIAISRQDTRTINLLLDAGADLALALQTWQWRILADCCAQLSFPPPPLRLVRFYDPRTRTLAFKNAGLTNETAAVLPLANWMSLAALDFRGNPYMTEIPVSLVVLRPVADSDALMRITFDMSVPWSNPFEEQIAQSGNLRAVVEYSRLKMQGGMVPVNERKLMAIGCSAVGKTTLIRRLKDETYIQPLSTDGVDMGEMSLPTDNGGKMRVVIWDFAGQPLYRQTHLLFLRNPGVCLLLFKLTDDVSTSVDRLRFWCDTLRSLTSGATTKTQTRVLLVGTHLDRCADRALAVQHAEQVWSRLQESLEFSEPPVLVSCADGADNVQTIARLRAAITRMAQSMEIQAPACVETVRKALLPASGTSTPLLTSEVVDDIIVDYAVQMKHSKLAKDPLLRRTCLRSLEQTGFLVLLESKGCITHVVVNPQWVALLLASVVTTRHTWISRGRVTFATLSSQIWRGNSSFPLETHETLVTILEQLRVMFAVDKRPGAPCLPSQVFFIPCSLPEQRPRGRFSARPRIDHDGGGSLSAGDDLQQATTVRRWFRVTEGGRTIPQGVLPQIIVQMMTTPDTKIVEVWQQGGVFRIKSRSSSIDVSVIKLSSETIEVLVKAQHPHFAAEWIRDASTMVENQLGDVHHTQYEIQVPCDLADEETSPCFMLLDDLRGSIIHRSQLSCRPDGLHIGHVSQLAPDLLFADLGHQAYVHPWSAVKLVSRLGRGANGRVMLGRLTAASSSSLSTTTSSDVAVKLLERGEMGDKNDIRNYREFQHEAYLMSQLNHPNVVRFVGICFPAEQPAEQHENSPALLMEVIDGGTLYDSLTDAVGLLRVCRLTSKLMSAIGAFNLRASVYKPGRSELGGLAPLVPLPALCDGALGRIDQIFEQRIFARSTTDPNIPKLKDLRQQLYDKLDMFYKGPVTPVLHKATDAVLKQIKALTISVSKSLVPLNWPMRLKLATDLVQGLMHLHTQTPPLVHRDFKSLNAFLMQSLGSIDPENIDWQRPLAKLGDFGLSIRMLATPELTVGSNHAMNFILPTWAAPEVLSKKGYSTEADIYSVGITLWELLTRDHPFSEVHLPGLSKHVIQGGRPLIPEEFLNSEDEVVQGYVQLMKHCWHQDHEQRPSILDVYSRLRELSQQACPDLFATLPAPSLANVLLSSWGAAPARPGSKTPPQPHGQYQVTQVDPIELIDSRREPSRVVCLQLVGENSLWVGLSSGDIIAVQFDEATDELASQATPRLTRCTSADRHEKGVMALCYNASQQLTVWSGSKDGRIFVWSAALESLAGARLRCYLKTRFLLVNTTAALLSRSKGKQIHCVLRNGWLHCYLDEHVGPPSFELDLCRSDLRVNIQDGCNLELTLEGIRLVLRPLTASTDLSEDGPLQVWQRTVTYLTRLASDGVKSLSRLATAPKRNCSEFITALEATDDATWCLTLTTLVEWLLLETQHGLHSQLRLEPGRQLTFDMSYHQFAEPRLRSICGVAWVAPNVLWVGAANTIAFIDLTQTVSEARSDSSSSSLSSQELGSSDPVAPAPPSPCLRCSQVHEGSCSEPAMSFLLLGVVVECGECFKPIGLLHRRRPCFGCPALLCKKCRASTRLCRMCRSSERVSVSRPLLPSFSSEHVASHQNVVLQFPESEAHKEAIRLLVMVQSCASASGFEVWTYVHGEDILVWQTPLQRSEQGGADAEESEQILPVLFDRVVTNPEMPLLMCMKQVGSQVWAGTREGSIIAWDIETRALAQLALPSDAEQPVGIRPISDITSVSSKKHMFAVAANHGLTLRKLTLCR